MARWGPQQSNKNRALGRPSVRKVAPGVRQVGAEWWASRARSRIKRNEKQGTRSGKNGSDTPWADGLANWHPGRSFPQDLCYGYPFLLSLSVSCLIVGRDLSRPPCHQSPFVIILIVVLFVPWVPGGPGAGVPMPSTKYQIPINKTNKQKRRPTK